MAYEIRFGETPGKGFKRVARQQLRRIVEMLADTADAANGHHEARKCVKRLRALMILTRPVVGKARWAKIDQSFAKLAKALSGARDTTVILQLLDRLEGDQAEVLGNSGRQLRAKLTRQLRSSRTEIDFVALARRTKRLRKSIDGLPLRGLKFGALIRGLAADYHAGRRAYERAYTEGTPEAFHDLRKHVQRHWRHMHLFVLAWPAEMTVRIELAKGLSETLGEEHDFSLLRAWLDPNDRGPLSRHCLDQQHALRALARHVLSLVYAERPKALRRRLAGYWHAAKASGA